MLPDLITRASASHPEHHWFKIDKSSVLVRPRKIIPRVRESSGPYLICSSGPGTPRMTTQPCRLFGRMIDLPEGVRTWTNDLKQEAERPRNPDPPSLPGATEQNALSDAC